MTTSEAVFFLFAPMEGFERMDDYRRRRGFFIAFHADHSMPMLAMLPMLGPGGRFAAWTARGSA